MPLPGWLRRWAAGVLEFIEEEARQLPALLLANGGGGGGARSAGQALPAPSSLSAMSDELDELAELEGEGEPQGAAPPRSPADLAADVEHHRRGRVQALAFALDKAKLFLRHQVGDLSSWKWQLRSLPCCSACCSGPAQRFNWQLLLPAAGERRHARAAAAPAVGAGGGAVSVDGRGVDCAQVG